MAVYLIHFDTPVAPGRHTCQHYIGWTPGDILSRVAVHRTGKGARLTAVAVERGISFDVVRVWPDGDRELERRLKKRKSAPRLCPVCRDARKRARTGAQLRFFFDLDDIDEIPF
jgi:hypothetical protein